MFISIHPMEVARHLQKQGSQPLQRPAGLRMFEHPSGQAKLFAKAPAEQLISAPSFEPKASSKQKQELVLYNADTRHVSGICDRKVVQGDIFRAL